MRAAVMLVVVAVVAALGVGAALVLRDGGELAAESASDAVGQVDVANDVRVRSNLMQAAAAAQMLVAEGGGTFDAAEAEVLAGAEPSFTFTTGRSTGPGVISVASSAESWSVAARSAAGTCLWLRLDASGARSYGSGTPCTGAAAAGASEATW